MEPEKFLTHAEFSSLLKAAKDDRERCILLLLAGAGLRVSEMTQIRIEDVDFNKSYLHVPALNAKFKKSRTVVLLPQVFEAISMQLAG
jgi:integrase/recombinase XerD